MSAVRLICLAFSLLLLAHHGLAQPLRTTREYEFKPPSPEAAAQDLVQEYTRLKAAQDWPGALRVSRDLLDKTAQASADLKVDIRVIGIDALGNFVTNSPADRAGLDREALGYHRDAIQFAGQDALRVAQANIAIGLYYSKTWRNGVGTPYLRQAIDYYTSVGDKFQVLRGYNDMAGSFADRGETDVSYYFRDKALAAGEEYFQIGVSPPAGQEWITYADLLVAGTADATDRHDLARIEKNWALLQRISTTYFTFKFREHFRIAPYFAMAGDERRARAILAEGQRLLSRAEGLTGESKQRLQIEGVCSEAMIEWAAKRFDRAADLYGRCAADVTRVGEGLRPSTLINHGTALEKSGRADPALARYEDAIRVTETTRSSYSVADRAAIFGNPVFREPYWGRIRILAERASRTRSANDFFTALGATERIRARQFGELLFGDGGNAADGDIAPARLQGFASQLGEDTVAIGYTLMTDRVIILAFTRTDQMTASVPLDGNGFAAELAEVHKRLANPRSPVAEIERDLLGISRTLIAPVAAFIAGKRQIMVLQDGALNMVPFGLISARPDAYEPLLQQSVIRVLPSLRIEQQRRATASAARRSIFALGDPAFAPAAPATILSRGEIAAVSRGSPYLQYFTRLPGTRREVESIVGLVRGEKSTSLLGSRATESAIKRSDLRSFSYIHLATHGVLGGELPGLNEPALVLAQENGEDGLLTATEAAQLRLGAELTVLSACNTGSGRLLAGEGVLGMSRAFLLAGSRAVVVSLWPIDDDSTALLMQRLYQNKLAGMATPEALRDAALEMRRSRPHPAIWAPFIAIGS